MIARCSVVVIFLSCSALCCAQSYSCGNAVVEGGPAITQYQCSILYASFRQSATWNTACWREPIFGGAQGAVGSGSINASGNGICGAGPLAPDCPPLFYTVQDNATTVTPWAKNATIPIGCIHGSSNAGFSYTCTVNCTQCSLAVDRCPCTTNYTCTVGCCTHPGQGGGSGGGNSPIVLDTFEEGFHLTSLNNGVEFHVLPGGPLTQMSWTDANWRNGWLALDRNGDGTIDDFTELFGNLTAQPPSSNPNGFLALAVFDDPANGGNGNGFIGPGDAVYSSLRVWIDANHNGISEPNELHTLQELGIFKIGLKFRVTPFVDE